MNQSSRGLLAVGTLVVVALIGAGGAAVAQDDPDPPAKTSQASHDQPYAGLENRTIRALSAELIDDLLAGRGAGYALAAELNHYPGPTHVLALADELDLSSEQRTMTQEIFGPMELAAQGLGAELVDLESRLDEAFRSSTIDQASLIEITAEIARVDGELRAVHLGTHLDMQHVLTPEQVGRYDELRGYAPANSEPAPSEHSGDHSGHLGD
jgi:Spy/CpxP family protein refolding chaperone